MLMTSILYRHLPILGLGAVLLAGCASISAPHREADKAQPLQRMNVPQEKREHDALAHTLAGEFALNSGDLDAAADEFGQAAQGSSDPDIAARHACGDRGKDWNRACALERWQSLKNDDPAL